MRQMEKSMMGIEEVNVRQAGVGHFDISCTADCYSEGARTR